MASVLADEQIARYHRDGYLVVEDFVSAESRAALRQRANEIVSDFHPRRASVFTTNEQDRVSDGEFLSSGV